MLLNISRAQLSNGVAEQIRSHSIRRLLAQRLSRAARPVGLNLELLIA